MSYNDPEDGDGWVYLTLLAVAIAFAWVAVEVVGRFTGVSGIVGVIGW